MSKLTDHVAFNDRELAARYSRGRMPMATLYEAYFDGDLDIPGDIDGFIAERAELVSYRIERRHLQWLATHFLPEALLHTQPQDARIVRAHYDRGNDFFEWFLGPRMLYTAAYSRRPTSPTERASCAGTTGRSVAGTSTGSATSSASLFTAGTAVTGSAPSRRGA